MRQTAENRPRRDRGSSKFRAAFYRQCRDWHAYLSAFAFIALMSTAVAAVADEAPSAEKARVAATASARKFMSIPLTTDANCAQATFIIA